MMDTAKQMQCTFGEFIRIFERRFLNHFHEYQNVNGTNGEAKSAVLRAFSTSFYFHIK